jgi:hypothetical protein
MSGKEKEGNCETEMSESNLPCVDRERRTVNIHITAPTLAECLLNFTEVLTLGVIDLMARNSSRTFTELI